MPLKQLFRVFLLLALLSAGLSSCRAAMEDMVFQKPDGQFIPLYQQTGFLGQGGEDTIILEEPVELRLGDQMVLVLAPGTQPFQITLYPPKDQQGGVQTGYSLTTQIVTPPRLGDADNRRLEISFDPLLGLFPPDPRTGLRVVDSPEPSAQAGDQNQSQNQLQKDTASVQLGGFSLSNVQDDSNVSGRLLALRIKRDAPEGFYFSADKIGITADGEYRHEITVIDPVQDVVESVQDIRLSARMVEDPGPNQLRYYSISYQYQPPEDRLFIDPGSSGVQPRVRIELLPALDSRQRKAVIEMVLHPGEHRSFFYPAELGFTPQFVRVISREPGFLLTGIEWADYTSSLEPRGSSLFSMDSPPIPEALPVDLGTLLRYPQAAWRHRDFELFSWDLYPEIFVFDFRTREIQSAFFKRLAFFTEKKNFRGSLLTNTQLNGRHGWNAHNYRAQGLAEFFTQAARQGFPLNPEELYLRRMMIEGGVITPDTQDEGVFLPGTGGIISITRDTRETNASRLLFLTHEALHGIYYQSPELVQQSQAEWRNLTPESREYLTRYFSYMQYDPEDQYLMENEFQAYLLQQPLDQLVWTLGGRYRDRLMATYPNEAGWFRSQASLVAAEARDVAYRLQNLLFRKTGLLPGDFRAQRRIFE